MHSRKVVIPVADNAWEAGHLSFSNLVDAELLIAAPPFRQIAGVLLVNRIANAHGVPGTIGFYGRTLHDDRLVLVTSAHVLFGGGGREDEPVWLLDDSAAPRLIGRSLYGREGVVHHVDGDVYVDCAVAAVDEDYVESGATTLDRCNENAPIVAPPLTIGETVTTRGGREGIVVDASNAAPNGSFTADTPRQILIRSRSRALPFSTTGDSGAAVYNTRGEIAGLLWGLTKHRESIACPVVAVLYVLNIRAASFTRRR
jgi:hypothetical protein